MAEWQPIESAPRDGTHILAVLDWLPNPVTLFWNRHPEMSCWENPSSGIPDYVDDMGGWSPTHWMPLPEPPPL